MFIYKLACKFEKLVIENNRHYNSLFSVANLYEPLGDEDQLRSSLQEYLKKTISNDVWQTWTSTHEEKLKNLIDSQGWISWSKINYGNGDGVYHSPYGGSEEWILTKNIHGLRSSYEEDGLDMHIREASLLQGVNTIPNLYLIHTDVEGQFQIDQPEKESVEVAHNSFITFALNQLFDRTIPSEEIIDFINKNKSKINELRRSFQMSPQYLGGGADGVAFLISPSLVLKIFKEKFAYDKALEAWNRLHLSPKSARTEAMIYDVGELGTCDDSPVYYYIMEKMQPLRVDLRNRGSSVDEDTQDSLEYIERNIHEIIVLVRYWVRQRKQDLFEKLKKDFAKHQNSSKLNQEIKSIAVIMARNANQALNERNQNMILNTKREIEKTFNTRLRQNWLSVFIEEIIVKYLTSRTDLHTGNVGITSSGYLRYYDPAHPRHLSL